MATKGADLEPPALAEPEFVELAPLQEEVPSWPTEVEELHVETLTDLPAEPIFELVPLLAAVRASFFLRSPNVYDHCKSFYRRRVHRRLTL